ncbi:MAG TPA: NHLP bacteriocin export ABC transporter permease/ATPase subunit [Pantanalinema sp.]
MPEERPPEAPGLEGNRPFPLDDPLLLAMVERGEIAVFAQPIEPGGLPGARRHLFTVTAGEAIGGLGAHDARFRAVGVALGPALLRPIGPEEGDDREEFARAALGWSARLAHALAPAPAPASAAPDAGRIALAAGEAARIEGSWVMAVRGEARWQGLEEAILTPELGPVPFGPGTWLHSPGGAELLALGPQAPLTGAQREAGLLALGRLARHGIDRRLSQYRTADAERIGLRHEAESRAGRQANRALAGILAPPSGPEPAGDPLFAALCAIGASAGLFFQPAPGEAAVGSDPLEAIARASHVRHRRVRLKGDWWRRDNGPLLAYAQDDRRPIALLPVSPRRYHALDPAAGTRQPVDAALALALRPHAIAFYPPFPDRPLAPRDLLQFAWGLVRVEARMILSVAALSAALGIAVPQASYWLLAAVIPSGDERLLLELGLALFVISAALPVLRLVQDFAVLRAETTAEAALDAALWDRVLGMQLRFFKETPAGDLAQRMGSIGQLRRALIPTTVQLVVSGVFSLTLLAQLFLYSAPMAVVALLVGGGIVAYMGVSAELALRERRRVGRPAANTQAQVISFIDGLAKIRVAKAEAQAFAKVVASYAVNEREDFLVQRFQDRLAVVIDVAPLLSMAVFYSGFAAQASAPGGVSQMGAFIAFTTAFGGFFAGAIGLGGALSNLIDTRRKWRKLMALVNAPLETRRGGVDPGPLSGAIRFNRLSFRYGPASPYVLRDLSLRIQAGEFVALVGASGSGKSTLLRLLLGFETSESGKIYLDGNDFAGLDLHAVRRQIGTVLQHGRISRGTLQENVANGHPLTYDQVREACEAAGLAEDLAAMPMGLYTAINEGGSNLSAGQRQRLLIARALARKPSILLFDEATSALDGRTQAQVTRRLRQLSCTRVVVAHRLSTIRQADRIVVLEGGAIVQEGKFETLSREPGPFADLMGGQLR